MRKLEISLLIGLIFSIFMGSMAEFDAKCDDIRENMLRLHVLANSDTDEDQALKLKVRDEILENSQEIFSGSGSKDEAEGKVAGNLRLIEETAAKAIAENGYNYPVKASLVNMYFTTRVYDGVSVPAGRYDAVRVEIGEGIGENWWCVMFPPMCVPAVLSEDNDESKETELEREIRLIGTQPIYKPKFAVVELIENVKNILSGEKDDIILVE